MFSTPRYAAARASGRDLPFPTLTAPDRPRSPPDCTGRRLTSRPPRQPLRARPREGMIQLDIARLSALASRSIFGCTSAARARCGLRVPGERCACLTAHRQPKDAVSRVIFAGILRRPSRRCSKKSGHAQGPQFVQSTIGDSVEHHIDVVIPTWKEHVPSSPPKTELQSLYAELGSH